MEPKGLSILLLLGIFAIPVIIGILFIIAG